MRLVESFSFVYSTRRSPLGLAANQFLCVLAQDVQSNCSLCFVYFFQKSPGKYVRLLSQWPKIAVNFLKLRSPCRQAYQLPCKSGSIGLFKCCLLRAWRSQISGKLSLACTILTTTAPGWTTKQWRAASVAFGGAPAPLGVNCRPLGPFWQASWPSWDVQLINGWLLVSYRLVLTWS